MPKVLITRSAWQVVTREVNYFANHPQGSKEAIIYPLFGFLRHENCLKKPWDMLTLDDIKYFIVTHAFAPPRNFCDHSGAHAGFTFKSDKEREIWERLLYSWSKPYTDKYPTLEIGNIHSHQFAIHYTWPSGSGWNRSLNYTKSGGLWSRLWSHESSSTPAYLGQGGDYARIYKFWEHLRLRKLDTALEIIICQSKKENEKWRACSFGFDLDQRIVSLGLAEVVRDSDKRVKEVLAEPFSRKYRGRSWEYIQRKTLSGIKAIDNYYFGWRTARIIYEPNKMLFVYFPPSFPDTGFVFYQTYDKAKKTSSKTRKWEFKYSVFRFCLKDIVKHVKEKENERS